MAYTVSSNKMVSPKNSGMKSPHSGNRTYIVRVGEMLLGRGRRLESPLSCMICNKFFNMSTFVKLSRSQPGS